MYLVNVEAMGSVGQALQLPGQRDWATLLLYMVKAG